MVDEIQSYSCKCGRIEIASQGVDLKWIRCPHCGTTASNIPSKPKLRLIQGGKGDAEGN